MQVFQDGEYLLREGEELGSDAKFYLIDSGAVHCYKTFEVRMQAYGSPAVLGAPFQGFCDVHTEDQNCKNARSLLLFFPNVSRWAWPVLSLKKKPFAHTALRLRLDFRTGVKIAAGLYSRIFDTIAFLQIPSST